MDQATVGIMTSPPGCVQEPHHEAHPTHPPCTADLGNGKKWCLRVALTLRKSEDGIWARVSLAGRAAQLLAAEFTL